MEYSVLPIIVEVKSGPNLITIRINVERTEEVVKGTDLTKCEEDVSTWHWKKPNQTIKPKPTPEESWERRQLYTPDELEDYMHYSWSGAMLMTAIKRNPERYLAWKQDQEERRNRMMVLLEKRKSSKGISVVSSSSLVVGEGQIYMRINRTQRKLPVLYASNSSVLHEAL
jgi:hypothetical protein